MRSENGKETKRVNLIMEEEQNNIEIVIPECRGSEIVCKLSVYNIQCIYQSKLDGKIVLFLLGNDLDLKRFCDEQEIKKNETPLGLCKECLIKTTTSLRTIRFLF
jgi:hypothetical protein